MNAMHPWCNNKIIQDSGINGLLQKKRFFISWNNYTDHVR